MTTSAAEKQPAKQMKTKRRKCKSQGARGAKQKVQKAFNSWRNHVWCPWRFCNICNQVSVLLHINRLLRGKKVKKDEEEEKKQCADKNERRWWEGVITRLLSSKVWCNNRNTLKNHEDGRVLLPAAKFILKHLTDVILCHAVAAAETYVTCIDLSWKTFLNNIHTAVTGTGH